MFIKSKKHKIEGKGAKSQLRGVTKARQRARLDKGLKNDKGLRILGFVNKSRDTGNSGNKYSEGIDEIVQKHFQQYIHYTCNDPSNFLSLRPFMCRSLQEILDRANLHMRKTDLAQV